MQSPEAHAWGGVGWDGVGSHSLFSSGLCSLTLSFANRPSFEQELGCSLLGGGGIPFPRSFISEHAGLTSPSQEQRFQELRLGS